MHLISEWIPALDGVKEKLERGARVADVGCGHGVSVILMAKAFPKSRFFGFDYHQPSIDRAREMAREEGVADRAIFEARRRQGLSAGPSTWSPFSTACMTWAIRSARPRT